MVTMKGPRVDFLPLTGLHEEPELWYQQRLLAPVCLLRGCRRIWVSLSWFLNLPYWLRFSVLFGSGAGYLLPPSKKDTKWGVGWGWQGRGRSWVNIPGIPTHGLDTEWGSVERYCVIPTRSKDAGRKMPGELPTQWKGTG